MQYRQYPLVFLMANLLLAILGESALAFSITPQPQPNASILFQESATYQIPGFGTSIVNMITPEPIQAGGTSYFKTLLNTNYQSRGWNFDYDTPDLKGKFEIERYYPSALSYNNQTLVGGNLLLKYYPSNEDPTDNDDLRWLQLVSRSDYPTDFFDNQDPSQNPYYPTNIPGVTKTTFADGSAGSIFQNISWMAELYLVKKTGGKNAKIYNGIKWGWTNKFTPAKTSKNFSGTLASGYQQDQYQLQGLTPGSKYTAWTNNDLPSNRCNPNTYLTASSPGNSIAYDDNSSPVGNGFASGLTGTVGSSGNINLNIRAAGGGARGQDKGNYELFVNVYDSGESPSFSNGNSGGGGVSKEMRGLTQQNPILPNTAQNGWQTFNKVPGCRWYDPYTTYGFEFQALEDTLFTEILDFPVGEDTEFAVTVGNVLLGNFGPGSSLDFVSLLGKPVSNFKITGISSLIGSTPETAFPIQLAFKEREGSFKMRAFSEDDAEAVPEPTTILAALLAAGGLATFKRLKNRKLKQP